MLAVLLGVWCLLALWFFGVFAVSTVEMISVEHGWRVGVPARVAVFLLGLPVLFLLAVMALVMLMGSITRDVLGLRRD